MMLAVLYPPGLLNCLTLLVLDLEESTESDGKGWSTFRIRCLRSETLMLGVT